MCDDISRRDYLIRQTRMISGCIAVGGILSTLGSCTTLRFIEHELEGRRVIVRRDLLGDDDAVLIDLPERLSRPIYLRRLQRQERGAQNDSVRYLALSTRCTHRGCQVEPEGGRLVCPCHGSEFTLAGNLLRGPADRDLLRFHVLDHGEFISIELPESGDHS